MAARKPAAWLVAVCLLAGLAVAGPALAAGQRPGRIHEVYFQGTPNELNVYRVLGSVDGKTLMIIGGIQGDEPGGFLSADLYADLELTKGNLIVVPRANFYSIILNHRGPDGDMNRQFGDPVTARRHKQIVDILKKLIAKSDMLLNLHDGSGFYRPRWEGPMANPKRYGQSLIADTDVYDLPDGKKLDLKAMAERVLARVNPQIENPKYRLLFNNHRTASRDSKHKEQRLSATYYALSRCHIPAFGVETSKSLPNNEMKVRHHKLAINAFMEELGVVPESPGTRLAEPKLDFLVLSVNDRAPLVVADQGTVAVHPGDTVKFLHIEANYERGLTCDLLGQGTVNDLRQSFVINKPSKVMVRKDHTKIGKVSIKLAQGEPAYAPVRSPMLYFLVEVEGRRNLVARGESLQVIKGDSLTLVEVLSNLADQKDLQVNFKGYVPPGRGGNQGEDRGYAINTGELLKRYSSCSGSRDDGVECYNVLATQGGKELGVMRVEVLPAKLEYLVLNKGGHKLVYYQGETVKAGRNERIELVDMKTNVSPGNNLTVALDGKGRRLDLPDGLIDTSRRQLRDMAGQGSEARLVVLRADQAIGYVRLTIGDN